MIRFVRRRLHRLRRRGWSSKRYVLRAIHTNRQGLAFPNAIYAWLIMTGMVSRITRRPTNTYIEPALVDWDIHPRNVMAAEFADRFVDSLDIVQSVDRVYVRAVSRYGRLLGVYFTGSTVTAEDIMQAVDAVRRD